MDMVDSQSENERRIKLERIIANIKQSNHNIYTVDQANKTDLCVNKNSLKGDPINAGQKSKLFETHSPLNIQSNITNYFTIAKTAPDMRSSTIDITIRSLLNTLKTNKESNIVKICEDNSAKVKTGSCQVQNSCSDETNHNFTSGRQILTNEVIHGKHEHGEQLNTSAEVIRKTHNYHKKQNNKRLKLCNNTKQLFVTDFFYVDHRIRSNKTSNVFSDDETKKSKLLDVPEIAKNNSIENNADVTCCNKNVGELKFKNENNIRESVRDKKYESLCNVQPPISKGRSVTIVAKNSTGQMCDVNPWQENCTNLINCTKGVPANKNVFLKAVKQDKNDQNKTTFDDFCKNVIAVIDENSKENKKPNFDRGKKQLQFSCKTPNLFPKSYSAGYLVGNNERKSCKDLSSLPITNVEIKSRKEKLMQSKITFDDFMENILKDINTSIIESGSGKSIDVSSISEENKNAKDKKRNIKHLTESLGSDGHDTVPMVMDIAAKHCSSALNTEDLCQVSENIIQKRNSSRSKHILTNANNNSLENLEQSPKNFGKGEDEDMDKFDDRNEKTNAQSGEAEESESEDFLSYFPKHSSENNNFKESPVELLKAETKNITDLNCNEHDYALPSQDIFALNICNEVSRDISPQENSGVMPLLELIREEQFICENDNLEAQSNCEYLNFSESNTYVETINQNSIMSESDMIRTRSTEQSENSKTDKLDRFLLKLLQQNTLRDTRNFDENHESKASKKKTYIKRYRKGKTKIYRLKKLKRISSKTKVLQEEENNLNFDDVFKKITQDITAPENNYLSRSTSMSSISTSSSYITDVTRSEILSTGSGELSSPEQRLRKGFNYLSKDKSLLFCEEQWENSTEYDKEEIKIKIQEIVSRVVEDFSQKNGSSLKYRKQSFENCIFKDGRLQLKPAAEASITVINSRAQRSQARFTLILYILKKIQNLLETDTKLTKRELYYQLKTSVKDQRITDRAINAISCLLDVGMWALNIIAQKGLVFGNLKILLSSGETLNCNIPGTLIPQDINDIVEIESPAYFILVVEKESIFYKLIEEDLPNRLTRPFIMITGKGFPDLNTQLFLKKLWMIMSIPVFILVDADPHGINIMLNYRFGSVNNAHVSHHLAVPQAKWLGVYPSEVINLNITRELLSERELKLVSDLLKTPYMSCNPRIVNELEVLLEKKYKAEIEGLIKSDTYLSEVYLPNKFFTHNFI